MSTDVKSVRGNKSTTYAPVVRYQYNFAGSDHMGSEVTAIPISASRNWAEDLRQRFHPGDIVTAYVNPAKPSSAFLVRDLSLFPLWFVLFPLAFGALPYWIDRSQRRRTANLEAQPVPIIETGSA